MYNNYQNIWRFIESEYNYRKCGFSKKRLGSECYSVDAFLDIVNQYGFKKAKETGWNGLPGIFVRLFDHVYKLKTKNNEVYYISNPYLSKSEIEDIMNKFNVPKEYYEIWEKPVYAFSSVIMKEGVFPEWLGATKKERTIAEIYRVCYNQIFGWVGDLPKTLPNK